MITLEAIIRFIKSVYRKIQATVLKIFGYIKVYPAPMFIVYDPSYFKMTGDKMREVENLLKPGDIICRGYDNYLDSYFIALTSPDRYSHAGVYIGDNKIIHAMQPRVREDDILDFMECDRIVVFRPRKGKTLAIKRAKSFLAEGTEYDYDFKLDSGKLYCFELAAECYKELDKTIYQKKALFGLVKRNLILASSFAESKDFTRVFEYNPKQGIYFKKETPSKSKK